MDYDYTDRDDFIQSFLCLILLFFLLFCVLYLSLWKPAEIESKIYNLKFGTDYTTSEFLFAGNTIKMLLEKEVPQRPKTYQLYIKGD